MVLFIRVVDQCAHANTTATTKTIISSVCSKCGTIGKSRKTSCCGRGGSWFRNCGASGNPKFDHTWSEGIQTCEALTQSKPGIAQHLDVAKQITSESANDADIDATIMTVKMPTPVPSVTPTITPVYRLVNTLNKSPIHTSIAMSILTTATVYSSASVSTLTVILTYHIF